MGICLKNEDSACTIKSYSLHLRDAQREPKFGTPSVQDLLHPLYDKVMADTCGGLIGVFLIEVARDVWAAHA